MKTICTLFILLSFTAIQAQKANDTPLLVIQKAENLLATAENWYQSEDNRHCTANDGKTFSLYCALYQASVEVQGKYKHRGKVMATVRRVIKEKNKGKRFKHPIRDFNNMASTNFMDIKELLQAIKKQLSKK